VHDTVVRGLRSSAKSTNTGTCLGSHDLPPCPDAASQQRFEIVILHILRLVISARCHGGDQRDMTRLQGMNYLGVRTFVNKCPVKPHQRNSHRGKSDIPRPSLAAVHRTRAARLHIGIDIAHLAQRYEQGWIYGVLVVETCRDFNLMPYARYQ
jgi:hypothetical protein